ncbi:hypothetical protein I553_1099 [Mycobacterium xenopi 4042]|uniref:Uncharacterized protein n=1 Tax=Mycobacterium xenopi 4042 TaxID=1299334 RepID=X7Z9R9_MYCXE|nr:hypothetical protein I553_1099 [Mycobacterium xenopi 4042]
MAACSTSDGATRATRDRTESAKSRCSGVIAIGIARLPSVTSPSI